MIIISSMYFGGINLTIQSLCTAQTAPSIYMNWFGPTCEPGNQVWHLQSLNCQWGAATWVKCANNFTEDKQGSKNENREGDNMLPNVSLKRGLVEINLLPTTMKQANASLLP